MIRAAIVGLGRWGQNLVEGNFNGPSVYRFPKAHWRQQPEEGPAGGMTGRGVHVVDAMLYLAGHVGWTGNPPSSTIRRGAASAAIEGGPPFACPPEDAIHGVAALEAIVRSARSGRREAIG